MILINLLPYREARRQERKRQFFIALGGSVAMGVVIVAAWLTILQDLSSAQGGRNQFLQQQVSALDGQIKDIATLRSEIEELNARRREVEGLQTNRNLPVLLLQELVAQTPDGLHLISMRQVGDGVTLTGRAQSNDRVSELLRNLSRSATWLENPELLEIRAEAPGAEPGGPGASAASAGGPRQYQFSMRVKIRRPGAADKAGTPPARST